LRRDGVAVRERRGRPPAGSLAQRNNPGDLLMKIRHASIRTGALTAAWCFFATVAFPGSDSTNPTNHIKTISDGAGHTAMFAPKLTVDWTKSGTKYVVKSTSFKIENQDNVSDFYVAEVYILNNSTNKVLWSSSPSTQVPHQKSGQKKVYGEWSSGDISGSLNSLEMNGMKVEYRLTFGSATTYLLWDPNVGGAGSTSTSGSQTGSS
jgi:hypothetical protein